ARLRAAGYDLGHFSTRRSTFAGLAAAAADAGFLPAAVILADLGVSSMQLDDPSRGFSYKGVGPFDMRMNPSKGMTAAEFLTNVSLPELVRILDEHADEPHAEII